MQSTTRLLKSKVCLAASLFLALSLGVSSCSKDGDSSTPPPQTIAYSGSFIKSSDNVTTSATGTVTGTFNPTTRELTYQVTWTGLTTTVVDMHFHDAGPVIIGITGFPTTTAGTLSGKATFTADQAADLAAGKIYVQIHTVTYPGGEIIATLTKGSNPPGNNPPPPPY